jgi:hypothetical protein
VDEPGTAGPLRGQPGLGSAKQSERLGSLRVGYELRKGVWIPFPFTDPRQN